VYKRQAQAAALHPNLVPLVTTPLGAGASGPTLTVRADTTVATGPIQSTLPTQQALLLENLAGISWKDSAGVHRPVIGVNAANQAFLRFTRDDGDLSFQNMSGAELFVVATASATSLVPFSAPSLTTAGGVGAFGTLPPAAKPVVTGSRGGNAALQSLLVALAATGLLTDGTTA
jgi:hypothetical protein